MKILIVDDFEQNLKLIGRILGTRGHSTVMAKNGEEGVRIAKTEQPGLILMDIQMPVMNGEDAMKILKAAPSTAHIPILACTSLVLDEDRLLKAGFDGYIPKPINLEEFLKTVEEVARQQSPK